MTLLLSAFLAAIAWILVGGLLYIYPPFKRIYKRAERAASVKKWDDSSKFMIAQFVSVFIQCFLFALVFSVVKVSLPSDMVAQALSFGLIVTAVKIVPRTMKMLVHTTYPGNLLFIEFLSSLLAAFGVSFIFVILI